MDWKQPFRFHNPRFRKICIVLLVIGKLGANVLYSDGTTKAMTSEEAEKLVAEKSPVPLEIDFDALSEEKQTP